MQYQYKNIKGLVFDKDGTLFDFNASWSEWCDRFVRELSDGDQALEIELAALIGYDKINRAFVPGSLVVSGAADDSVKVLSDRLPDYSFEQINEVGNRHLVNLPLVPVTELDGLLSTLKSAGLTLGVATNDSEASAISQLQQCEVSQHFNFVCGYDSGFGSKPAAGMLQAFCSATGLKASEVAMIGDSVHDLSAGRAAGVGLNIGVLTGPADESALSGYADFVLPDISGLPNLLFAL